MGSCGILGTVKSLMFGMCWIGASVANPCLTFYVDFDTTFGLICTHVFRIAVWIGSCNVLTRCVNCLVEGYRILSHLYREYMERQDNGATLALFEVTKCQQRRHSRKPEPRIKDKDIEY